MTPKAIVIMRAQPAHAGHIDLINRVKDAGYEPVIVLGSANIRDDRNPLPYMKRKWVMESEFPGISVEPLDDGTWEQWIANVWQIAAKYKTNVIAVYPQTEDRIIEPFMVFNKEFKSCYYMDVLKEFGFQTLIIRDTKYKGLHARRIRANPEEYKDYVSKSAYDLLQHYMKSGAR